MSDYLFILAASNVGYIIFNFLNLNAGWIHRMDRPHWERPYQAPTILIAIGGVLAYVNAALMGAGADVWGAHTLWTGLIFAALIIPVFLFRHYVQDKGVFPKDMMEDMHLGKEEGREPCGNASLRSPRRRRADRAAHALVGHQLGARGNKRQKVRPRQFPPRGRLFALRPRPVDVSIGGETRMSVVDAVDIPFLNSPIQVSQFARRRCARRGSVAGMRARPMASRSYAMMMSAICCGTRVSAKAATLGQPTTG